MTTVRLYFADERIGPKFERRTKQQSKAALAAIRGAANDVAEEAVKAGRADIAGSGGKFGPRWPRGLSSKVTEGGGSIRVEMLHDIPYFMVHQKGATIKGRPLLWIPLPGVDPSERGDFFARSRKGNLLLFKKVGKRDILPLRVAKKSVQIPKRFHVLEEARSVALRLPEFYRRRLAQSGAR